MATRSFIAAKLSNGKVGIIYCHFDGYPRGVGSVLQEHYQDQTKIDGLIALGALSVLAANIDCPEGHTFDHNIEGYCVAFGRDRGDEDTEATIADNYKQAVKEFNYGGMEYGYYWDGKNWFVDGKLLVHVLNMAEEDIDEYDVF